MVFAHAQQKLVEVAEVTPDVWDWNSPIALAIFFVGLTASLALIALAAKWLGESNRRR